MRKILGVAGLAALALTASACSSSGSSSAASGNTPAAPASSVASPAGSATAAAAGGSAVSATSINGTQVLVNSAGMTLYWFVPDTATTSKCTGSCATFWPPVKGPVTAGSGITGKLGIITRSDGSKQATYDGHPLYTFAGDTGAGQAKGNGVNESGGVWWEMETSGATPAPAAKASTGATATAKASSGGAYGY
jgi:predicted lipoprotein with Yx(FWY)xxD motif